MDQANLKDSYIIIRNHEAYLLNMFIAEYKEGNIFNHNETRTRKLLLHKKELYKLEEKINIKGFTIIPLKIYLNKGIIKIKIAVAKGKHSYDKKESIKQRDIKRETDKYLKTYKH